MKSMGLGIILQQNMPLINQRVIFLFINDLPKITTKNAKLVLCADDASIIVSNLSPEDFKINIKYFIDINEWFKSNLLPLKLKKKKSLPTI